MDAMPVVSQSRQTKLKLSAQHVNCAANEHDNYWHYLFNILAERIEVCRQPTGYEVIWSLFFIIGTYIMTDGHVVDEI